MLYKGCYTSWFTETDCSGNGICVNSTCLCNPNWTGSGPYFTLGDKDCSVNEGDISAINFFSASLCLLWTVLSFISLFLSRKNQNFTLKHISRDIIEIFYFLQQFMGTIFYFCAAKGYYIHTNLGIWFVWAFYMAFMLIYFWKIINLLIKVSYKLDDLHPPMVKITGIICLVGYIITMILYLAIVYTNEQSNIQLILIRVINIVFVIVGGYNSSAILFFGGELEKKLSENRNHNEENLNSIKRIKYVFALAICSFSSGVYPIFAIFPTIMQWVFALGLSSGTGFLFFAWHIKSIKKKFGLFEEPEQEPGSDSSTLPSSTSSAVSS